VPSSRSCAEKPKYLWSQTRECFQCVVGIVDMAFIMRFSVSSNSQGFSSILPGMASLPMSCKYPATCMSWHSLAEKPARRASAPAVAATPLEC